MKALFVAPSVRLRADGSIYPPLSLPQFAVQLRIAGVNGGNRRVSNPLDRRTPSVRWVALAPQFRRSRPGGVSRGRI